jgi:hypothetical protein
LPLLVQAEGVQLDGKFVLISLYSKYRSVKIKLYYNWGDQNFMTDNENSKKKIIGPLSLFNRV